MADNGVIHLDDGNFEAAVADGVTLVDFWAAWCGPCRLQGPILEELAAGWAGQVRIAKVNVDESPHMAARFRVQAIPLLVLLKDGVEVRRLVGMQSKAALRSVIEPIAP